MFWQPSTPTVTFATSCWEKDWRPILLDPNYLAVKQIGNHCFPFAETLLVINNVSNLDEVKRAAQAKVDAGVLTRFIVAEERAQEVLCHFRLRRSDFRVGEDASLYTGVNPDWIYYNALGPLTAIYSASNEYLLYLTGDVRLEKPISWIGKALRRMEKKSSYKVANLTWNENYLEAKAESYKKEWNFYVAKQGFSDQMFLVRTNDFLQPIYGEIRPDSNHFPRGDVWEKRVFSFMKNRGWERITFRRGSYTHKNF